MTKRFTQKNKDDWEIFDNGKHLAYAYSGYNAEDIISVLNELFDETEQLKSDLVSKDDLIQQLRIGLDTNDRKEFLRYRKMYSDVCEDLALMNKDYKKLLEENERLKKELKVYKKDEIKTPNDLRRLKYGNYGDVE